MSVRNGLCIVPPDVSIVSRDSRGKMTRRLAAACHLTAILLAIGLGAGCSTDPAEHVARGDAYVAEKKLAEAVVEYRNAFQQEPLLGEVRLKLARVYEQLNQP